VATPERPGSYTTPPPPGAGGPLPGALPGAEGRLVLASWGRRVAAYLLDALIVVAIAAAIMAPLGVGVFAVDSETGWIALVGAFILAVLVVVLVALLYAPVLMWRTNGKTVGRMAAGTRVIRVDGRPMSFGLAMVREVLLKGFAVGIASSIIPLLPFLLDVLWPLWDDENRALHDFPVNTRTIVD
jgi:uncharacterized RDD family membrane protein YckC